jgi:hypothetical protein
METGIQQELRLLQDDLQLIKDALKEVSADMIREGFTNYPVFLASPKTLPIGEPLFQKEDYEMHFNINASTLEAFAEKGLINPERVEAFKSSYKDPAHFMCFLLASPAVGAHFVFIPFSPLAHFDAAES